MAVYSRGTDKVSAMKYFYSHQDGAEFDFSNAHSELDVLRIVFNYNGEAKNITELYNNMVDGNQPTQQEPVPVPGGTVTVDDPGLGGQPQT